MKNKIYSLEINSDKEVVQLKTNTRDLSKVCTITLGHREQQYILKRSSRKTVGIAIESNGVIKVTSPFRMSESHINELLQKKAAWILNKLSNIETRVSKANKAKVFEEGEFFDYLGKKYNLKLIVSSELRSPTVRLQDNNLIITIPNKHEVEKLKDTLMIWYLKQFKLVIQDRIKYYSSIIGVFPQKITIREQKTRWGSCSAKGNINLNWKLIMAPLEVLDYVVIHELCHMKQMNHSKEFWKLVENVIPQHKKYRAWLKENGDNLGIE